MRNKIWEKINKPIWALAPMAGLTDPAFRQICTEFGADAVYSEMASAAALCYQPAKTLELLVSSKKENNYVIQLFGSQPEQFAQAVKLLMDKRKSQNLISAKKEDSLKSRRSESRKELLEYRISNIEYLPPQGFDINFGCPVKKVQKQGAGAVLMDKPRVAREIIKAALDATDLPVSVKIRSRVGATDALKFLENLNDLDIAAVMIHGRTLAQGHSGPVDTGIIKNARRVFGGVILANGGAMDAESAWDLLKETEADGVGIARGALGQPWIFREIRSRKLKKEKEIGDLKSDIGEKGEEIGNWKLETNRHEEINRAEFESLENLEESSSVKERFEILLKHAALAYENKGEKGIIEGRPHWCAYVRGLPGAKEMRSGLIRVNNLNEIKQVLIDAER